MDNAQPLNTDDIGIKADIGISSEPFDANTYADRLDSIPSLSLALIVDGFPKCYKQSKEVADEIKKIFIETSTKSIAEKEKLFEKAIISGHNLLKTSAQNSSEKLPEGIGANVVLSQFWQDDDNNTYVTLGSTGNCEALVFDSKRNIKTVTDENTGKKILCVTGVINSAIHEIKKNSDKNLAEENALIFTNALHRAKITSTLNNDEIGYILSDLKNSGFKLETEHKDLRNLIAKFDDTPHALGCPSATPDYIIKTFTIEENEAVILLTQGLRSITQAEIQRIYRENNNPIKGSRALVATAIEDNRKNRPNISDVSVIIMQAVIGNKLNESKGATTLRPLSQEDEKYVKLENLNFEEITDGLLNATRRKRGILINGDLIIELAKRDMLTLPSHFDKYLATIAEKNNGYFVDMHDKKLHVSGILRTVGRFLRGNEPISAIKYLPEDPYLRNNVIMSLDWRTKSRIAIKSGIKIFKNFQAYDIETLIELINYLGDFKNSTQSNDHVYYADELIRALEKGKKRKLEIGGLLEALEKLDEDTKIINPKAPKYPSQEDTNKALDSSYKKKTFFGIEI